MDIWEYLEVLFRWWWVIVLVTALCTTGALAITQLQTPRYTSMVEVSVMPSRLELELSQEVSNLLRNYVSSIQSEGMARRALEHMGLDASNAANLQRTISAEANEVEFRIKIEATDADPIRAQQIAQAVAELFAKDAQAFASRQDPQDRLSATLLNGGAQAAGQSWPRKKLLLFAGVAGGVFAGLLLALGLEWSRPEQARTPRQVEEWTGISVLASIPTPAQARRSKSAPPH